MRLQNQSAQRCSAGAPRAGFVRYAVLAVCLMTWGHETPRAQGGPPPNIIEASWMRDGGGELDAELYAVSIKNTVKGDSLSLTNRLAYAYGQYDNEPLPERMHQFSVMNDTNWNGRLFIGMLSYKADVLPRSIGDMEYFLAPGVELYRNGNWTLDGFIFVTNQFGYMIEDRYPVPVPFLALNYRSKALTARISVPCFVMLRAESGLLPQVQPIGSGPLAARPCWLDAWSANSDSVRTMMSGAPSTVSWLRC